MQYPIPIPIPIHVSPVEMLVNVPLRNEETECGDPRTNPPTDPCPEKPGNGDSLYQTPCISGKCNAGLSAMSYPFQSLQYDTMTTSQFVSSIRLAS